MKIKRFFAKDMRSALAEVKEVLGNDAVIMSNKKVSGGIEIVAAVDDDEVPVTPLQRPLHDDNVKISSHARQFVPPLNDQQQAETLQSLLMRGRQVPSPQTLAEQVDWNDPRLATESVLTAGLRAGRDERRYAERETTRGAGREPLDNPLADRRALDSQAAGYGRREGRGAERAEGRREPTLSQPLSSAQPQLHDSREYKRKESAKDKELQGMRQEIASIRRLLEHQVSGLMWQEVERREPVRALVIKQLNELGFSDGFADQLAMRINEQAPAHEAWSQIETALNQQLLTGEDEILRQGGAVALLGPTGVGKTTTIAKLAARFAARYGADQIALITTDHYRIGAHEQLQTYGRIMGVVVKQARTYQELAQTLYQLRHRRLVLIDTAGMGQRDLRLNEQLDTLVGDKQIKIRNYLVLPATAQRRVLQEAVDHFRRIPLAGCILTKLDESLSLGDVLDISIQNSLPISYITDGQRVPEDLRLANGQELVKQALGNVEQRREEPYYWESSESDEEDGRFYE
ncbi:flagellar biosynthesis protein FlhF [Oceanisphaera profunda]|uniref:Flagellar biosynthesis protein FlhF n=1 Tax=Oceanisphaera profunda TaxID=1416627 RepID=A0A1Y0D776_9GAMM|nr:flagellar biosynthesis protein FlhF [Oceanisphaera profunda]ART83389.1 flagellar biosynthesis protein FlhF [Oceanisphaera profunda]